MVISWGTEEGNSLERRETIKVNASEMESAWEILAKYFKEFRKEIRAAYLKTWRVPGQGIELALSKEIVAYRARRGNNDKAKRKSSQRYLQVSLTHPSNTPGYSWIYWCLIRLIPHLTTSLALWEVMTRHSFGIVYRIQQGNYAPISSLRIVLKTVAKMIMWSLSHAITL